MSSHTRTFQFIVVGVEILNHVYSATITLHNPYLNFKDSQSISTSRCVNATRSILASYYSLSETSLDITRLHPFVTVSFSTESISMTWLIDASEIDMLVSSSCCADTAVQIFHRDE